VNLREFRAAQKREEREARNRLRELERQRKEQAKLSAAEQARLQVEMHENQIDVLLSVHKERGPSWDWPQVAAFLPPPEPKRWGTSELSSQVSALLRPTPHEANHTSARNLDDSVFQDSRLAFEKEVEHSVRLKELAQRILLGDPKAYTEALSEFSPLTELSDLGSSIRFVVHSPSLIEATLFINEREVIPPELKTLTASGKLSVKAMPKARFHEIYQDHICSCVLRIAREVFALLPAKTVIVTAMAEIVDRATGMIDTKPVLSVAMPNHRINLLNFSGLDPSDAIETFLHRGDAKTSRKSGQFTSISPLTPADLPHDIDAVGISDLITEARTFRQSFTDLLKS
jgi:hypothetical protein